MPEVGRHGQPTIGPALAKRNWASTELLTAGPALCDVTPVHYWLAVDGPEEVAS